MHLIFELLNFFTVIPVILSNCLTILFILNSGMSVIIIIIIIQYRLIVDDDIGNLCNWPCQYLWNNFSLQM